MMNTNENFSEASEDEFRSVAVFGISAIGLVTFVVTVLAIVIF